MARGDTDAAGGPSTSADAGGSDDLAGRLSDLAPALQDEDGVAETLQAIVDAAIGTVPGAQYAALSVVQRRREVHTRAGTAEIGGPFARASTRAVRSWSSLAAVGRRVSA